MAHPAGERPPRMTITNIDTARTVEFQFNPEEIEKSFGANYARQTVQGLSHQVLQFGYTENQVLTFSLTFDALTKPDDFTSDDCVSALNFLEAFTFPQAGAAIRDIQPSRALFVWPGFMSLTTVMTKGKVKFTRSRKNGKNLEPTRFVVDVTLEEIRDFRINSLQIEAFGNLRLGAAP